MDKVLSWFIYVWIGLAVALAAIDIVSLINGAPSWWSGILAAQERWFDPLNLVHFTAAFFIFAAPSIGAFIWREKRRERSRAFPVEAKAKAQERMTQLEADTPRILREYASLHESFPGCVIDASQLPLRKDVMILVIKMAWLKSTSDELRRWLEDGWLLLSWFQDGVGHSPIDLREEGAKNIPPRQRGALLREKNDWLEVVLVEQEALTRALDRFKEAHAKST